MHLAIDPQVTRASDQELRKLQISEQPFKCTGSYNPGYKRLFSTFPFYDNNKDNKQINKYKPTVDKNGCPLTVHRGLTALRKKSVKTNSIGTGVPYMNSRLSYEKDLEWMPCPYVAPHDAASFLDSNNNSPNNFSKTNKPSFKVGSRIEYFDPRTRGLARNDTHAVDSTLLSWLLPGRVSHIHPFLTVGGVANKKEFLSGHPPFGYIESPFELSEKSNLLTNDTLCGFTGFRDPNHLEANTIPFRNGAAEKTVRNSNPGGATDRNHHFHSVQAKDQACYHTCNLYAANNHRGERVYTNSQLPSLPN